MYEFDSEDAAKARFGNEISKRFPDHGEFDHPCGCVHRDFAAFADYGRGWLQIALLTAAKYAERTVSVVAPQGFEVPSAVLSHDVCRTKNFFIIPLNRFSTAEREMIGTEYQFQYIARGDREARAVFRSVMKRYWAQL
jgi:hypothetical protein